MKIYHRLVVGFLFAVMLLVAERGYGQVAPDLRVSQTQGVTESDYFFLGPTGMKGWMYWYNLTDVSRQILITEVAANTPAQIAGLQYHDVILGTNDTLFSHDARRSFVEALTDAEATDGELDLYVYRPSLATTNSYKLQMSITNAPLSSTTPFDCPKSLAILTNYCEYVYTNGPAGSPTEEFSIWAMLGSGIPKYESWATNYIVTQYTPYSRTNLNIYRPDANLRAWHLGFQLITLSQYYLYTVDQGNPDYNVLPALTNAALYRANGQSYQGLVSHTFALPQNNGGLLNGSLPSYGPINLATMGGLYGMILARNCGVNLPAVDAAIQQSADFYRAQVGLGTISYGFGFPYTSTTDANGRNALAAFIFRALGEVEAAKWFAMMSATYGWRDWGHTGNEFNHAWGPLSASIGGPDLMNFVHTNLDNYGSSYFQVSLNMRRKPDGSFNSQGQAGQGAGRDGHATGSYALQMVTNRTIEITGSGYGSNYWLTADEMAEVQFAFQYEGAATDISVETTASLMNQISNFCPKVAEKVADELNSRIAADDSIRANLMAIVTDTNSIDSARTHALRALDETGRTNATIRATVDSWYDPTINSYMLMQGAIAYNIDDKTSQLAVLDAASKLDRTKTFDMLMAGQFGNSIYNMSTNGWSPAEIETYFSAVDIMLTPDAAGSWFQGGQNIKNWSAEVLARYADFLLEVSERVGLSYEAPEMLSTKPFGEGMWTWMVRSDYSPNGPYLDLSTHWYNYGMQAFAYTNQLRNLMACHNRLHYARWYEEDEVIQIQLPANGNPDLVWFRDQIAANIAADYSGATVADLQGLMTTNSNLERPLLRAVVLDKIVTAIGDASAFPYILPYVGSKVPIPSTDWRLYRAAIELGTNDTYSTDAQWTAALADAIASNDSPRITGILHVLAERGVDVRTSAEPYLLDDNDYLTIATLDLYRTTGTESDLVMLYNQFMTNCCEIVDGVEIFDIDYKIYAYWDAIQEIVARTSPSAATADALAAAFNAVTSNGSSMVGIANIYFPRGEPMSILNPTNSRPDKIYGQYNTGPIGILGLFPGNANCDAALSNVFVNIPDGPWATRNHSYAAAEAVMRQKTIAQILAINESGDLSRWNMRQAANYLLREILLDHVHLLSEQRDILTKTRSEVGTNLQRENGGFFDDHYQKELSRKRGLEEEDAVLYFFVQ